MAGPSLRAWMSVVASLRAPQWVHFCALPLAGVERTREAMAWGPLALAIVVTAGCLAYAYGINAVAERHSDRSARKNPLVGAPHLVSGSVAVSVLVGVAALAAAVGLGRWAMLAAGVSLASGTLYSVGIAGKRVPFVGLLLNTAIFAPLAGLLAEPGAFPASFSCELAVFIALLIQNQLVHELADLVEDTEARAMTTARLLGGRTTHLAILAVGMFTPVLALVLSASLVQVVVTACTALVATAVIMVVPRAASARRVHRVVALAGGAALWFVAWL